jgi:hypothetical protein
MINSCKALTYQKIDQKRISSYDCMQNIDLLVVCSAVNIYFLQKCSIPLEAARWDGHLPVHLSGGNIRNFISSRNESVAFGASMWIALTMIECHGYAVEGIGQAPVWSGRMCVPLTAHLAIQPLLVFADQRKSLAIQEATHTVTSKGEGSAEKKVRK